MQTVADNTGLSIHHKLVPNSGHKGHDPDSHKGLINGIKIVIQ